MPVPDFADHPLADLLSLDGRVALITGAGRGIGRATARRMAEAGAAIVLVGLDEDELRAAADEISSTFGRAAWPIRADIGDGDEVRAAMAKAIACAGRIDILVNNAGIFPSQPTLDISDGDWDRVLNVNLRGGFIAAREFVRHVRERDAPGVIVNIASVSAIKSAGNATHYVASKHALAGMTKSMAAELGRFGIRCIALAPSLIETPGVAEMVRGSPALEEEVRAYGAQLPLGRPGLADDVARVALFAASDLAGFVSGIVIPVDGGDLAQ